MNTIAVTGKGGVGKTTISALTVRWLVERKKTPILAVDADSNANFHEMLGVNYAATIGGLREEARKNATGLGGGVAKQHFLEMQVAQALVEQEGYDLLVMGRPEGPGCYCFANNVLRDALQRLSKNYRSIVVDCEAGLEHLSRRTVLEVDHLFTVSDPSLRGLRTAGRVGQVLEEMRARVRHKGLIVNKMRDMEAGLSAQQREIIGEGGFEEIVLLPEDDSVRLLDERGGAVRDILPESAIYRAMGSFLEGIFNGQ